MVKFEDGDLSYDESISAYVRAVFYFIFYN